MWDDGYVETAADQLPRYAGDDPWTLVLAAVHADAAGQADHFWDALARAFERDPGPDPALACARALLLLRAHARARAYEPFLRAARATAARAAGARGAEAWRAALLLGLANALEPEDALAAQRYRAAAASLAPARPELADAPLEWVALPAALAHDALAPSWSARARWRRDAERVLAARRPEGARERFFAVYVAQSVLHSGRALARLGPLEDPPLAQPARAWFALAQGLLARPDHAALSPLWAPPAGLAAPDDPRARPPRAGPATGIAVAALVLAFAALVLAALLLAAAAVHLRRAARTCGPRSTCAEAAAGRTG